ncbi:MAG: peptidylprolyl isomerase [candidate division WOR-3 bacterium]|nr:peptidylprolyl isomerase [candidate division WOR-3 bacterium]MCX7947309.1 peptidylprolyl isomerase [candidate division WOR-3 bacterium]MDW8150134.1 peptidylprolyl isomerase [candidate division WOR-3 bacterium]
MLFIFLFSDTLKLIDKVIAVVNDEPIFYSELEELYRATTLTENDSIKRAILENLIKQRVILALAKIDTTLNISEDEFQNFSKTYINNIYFQYGRIEVFRKIQDEGINPNDTTALRRILRDFNIPDSLINFSDPELANKVFLIIGRNVFEQELKNSKMTITEFIESQRSFISKQILIQKYISKYISPYISVTENEIREFYQTHKDSFPRQPNIYYLQQIIIPVQVSFEQEEKAYDKIKSIYKRLQKGENFNKLAKTLSDDSIVQIGWVKRDYLSQFLSQDIIIELFSQPKNSYTRPIRTPLGYNIFKIEDRIADSIKISHILVKVRPSSKDIENAREKVISILEGAKSDFEKIAREYSVAPLDIGYIPEDALPNDFKPYFKDAKQNSIIGPIYKDGFYAILRVKEFIPEKITTYDEVREQIKLLLTNKKIEEKISEIYEKHKKDMYIKIYQ